MNKVSPVCLEGWTRVSNPIGATGESPAQGYEDDEGTGASPARKG